MRWMQWVVLLVLAAVGAGAAGALAGPRSASLSPVEAVVLPADESGLVKVAVRFDLAGLPEGASRSASRAALEWTVAGLDPEGECAITAHRITGPWSAATVAQEVTVEYDEAEVDVWAIEPLDYARNGGYVKLHLGRLLEAWAKEEAPNYGVLVTFSAVDRTDLAGTLGAMRFTVRAGLSGD